MSSSGRDDSLAGGEGWKRSTRDLIRTAPMATPVTAGHRHALEHPPHALRTPLHPLKQHPPSIYDDAVLQDPPEVLLPPPSAWTTSSSHYAPDLPSPLEEIPAAPSSPQRSSTFLDKCKLPPLISRASSQSPTTHARSGPHSPTKSITSFISSRHPAADSDPTKTNNRRSRPVSSIHDWFYGESAPLQIGILPSPRKERDEPDWYGGEDDAADMFSRAPATTTSRPGSKARSNTLSNNASTASPFSWFSKASSPTTKSPSPTRSRSGNSDPFLDLDINSSLFPRGPVDPLAPNSFNDLLSAAEDTIQGLQAAYRVKCEYIEELSAEKDIEKEDHEEAETRARHLKVQLDDMAARASKQAAQHERLIRELSDQLAQEKKLRKQEEEARKRSIKLVTEDVDATTTRDRRKQNRRSHQSNASITDSGFESSSDSESESVFSRKHNNSNDFTSPATTATSTFDDPSHRPKPALTLLEPSGGVTVFADADHHQPSHYRGGSLSVNSLSDENYFLRVRVKELEEAVDSCLDMVSWMR